MRCISIAEEPLHHLQSVMLYLLFKAGIPRSNVIVLCGQGADSVWGAYLCNTTYKYMKWPHRLLSTYPMLGLLKLGLHTSGRFKSAIRFLTSIAQIRTQGDKYSIEKPDSIVWSLGDYGDEDWVCKFFDVTKYDIIKNRLSTVKPFLNRSIYDVISLLDFLGDVSVTQSIWAKLGESQRRILFYPYNRLELLDYAYSLPWDMKLRRPKNILRGVARQLQIPEFIITRPKSGFGINSRGWAEKGSVFEPLVPLASRVFDEKQIRAMQSADTKRAMTFWNILNYSVWKRLCIDNEPLEVLLEQLASHNSPS